MNSILGGRGQSRWSGLAVLAALGACSFSAVAHPGHELHEHGVRHALTSPDHALVLMAAGLGTAVLGYLFRASRAGRVLRWGGTCTVICGLALRMI